MKPLKGETLVSLLISLGLSALLLLLVAQFYAQTQQQNQRLMLQLKLQAELQRTIQLIGKDLRRVGFRAANQKLIEDNLALFELDEKGTAITIAQADNAPPNSCVLFFYDLNSNGCIGEKYTKNTCVNGVKNVAKNIEKELFGYKLNGKMIETKQTYKNAVNADCRSAECQRALTQSTCNAGGGWTDLLDEKEFEISQLRFDWLKAGKGIEIKLAGHLATHKHIQYETSLVVPLLNQEE